MNRARTALIVAGAIALAVAAGAPAGACPLGATTDAAKSHKLFLYFPAADDLAFPNFGKSQNGAKKFDAADLSAKVGTTAQLIQRVRDVVRDDYCEFNVQVLTTTTNPAQMMNPPARRTTVAIGSDSMFQQQPLSVLWGTSQETDIGDSIDIDFARVWAGTFTKCEGLAPAQTCTFGSLTGPNDTRDRWAQAIGGTAAHEGGHTYGLAHTDDDPNPDFAMQPGLGITPGEDAFNRHLMPAGGDLTGEDRTSYRRHFSDRTFGILAQNVGLTIDTMHNWDFTNPNAGDAHSLTIAFLSPLNAVTTDWSYHGATSPWIDPVVTGPSGKAMWKGQMYNTYTINWSTPNPAFATPGVVPGGTHFHVGATFTGVDFNQPDPIIIQNVTLFDAVPNPLGLHPRLPAYDAGTIDVNSGQFQFQLRLPNAGVGMKLSDVLIAQLPRVASIESMVGPGRPRTFDGRPIRPWSVQHCPVRTVRGDTSCAIAKLGTRHHVFITHRVGEPGVVDCTRGVPRKTGGGFDGTNPDREGPICAGISTDPFPSTTVYIIATVVDAKARHWDPQRRRYVVGPVTSRVYYQFAGLRSRAEQGYRSRTSTKRS